MGRYGFCAASSLIWGRWGGGLLFHFILSKTVVSKKIESIMYMYVQAPYPDTVSHLLILNISAFWSQKNKNLTTIMNIILLLLAIALFSWTLSSSHTWGCRQQCCNKGLGGNKERWTTVESFVVKKPSWAQKQSRWLFYSWWQFIDRSLPVGKSGVR